MVHFAPFHWLVCRKLFAHPSKFWVKQLWWTFVWTSVDKINALNVRIDASVCRISPEMLASKIDLWCGRVFDLFLFDFVKTVCVLINGFVSLLKNAALYCRYSCGNVKNGLDIKSRRHQRRWRRLFRMQYPGQPQSLQTFLVPRCKYLRKQLPQTLPQTFETLSYYLLNRVLCA